MSRREGAACRHAAAALLAALVLMLPACGGGGGGGGDAAAGPELPAADYLPLSADARWVMRDRSTDRLTVTRVVGPGQLDGAAATLLRSTTYGSGDSWDVVERSDTLYAVDAGGAVQAPAPGAAPFEAALGTLRLFRTPLREGDRFVQFDGPLDGVLDVDGDGRFDRLQLKLVVTVVGLETVDVPAGRFRDCLHLRTSIEQRATLSSDGRTVDGVAGSDDWLAPDVGPVRSQSTVGPSRSVIAERVLEAYRVGTRRSESVAPRLVRRSPVPASVSRTPAFVTAELSEAVDPESARQAFALRDAQGTVVPSTVTQGFDRKLYLAPATPLASGHYEVRLAGTLIDRAGNPLGADGDWSFEVDATGPSVVSVSPSAGSTRVPIDAAITLRFSEPILPGSVDYGGIRLVMPAFDGSETLATVTVDGTEVTLRPEAPLRRGAEYELQVTERVADLLGNAVAEPFAARFVADPGRFDVPVDVVPGAGQSVLADLDGDGRLDLLAVVPTPDDGFWSYALVLYRQRADGTLAPGEDLGWRGGARFDCLFNSLAVGDLDGNGRQDVAVANGGCGVQLFLQGLDGRLVAGPRLAPSARLQVADLDGDGRQDLLGLEDANLLRFWRQSAGGTFEAPRDLPTGITESLMSNYALADLDGDGRLDLAIGTRIGGDYTRQQLAVAYQQAGPAFVPGLPVPVPVAQLAAADLNGDGRTDVAVTEGDNDGGTLSVFYQRADGRLAAPVATPIEQVPERLALADIDGDGRVDVVVYHGSFGLGYLLQRATGGWQPQQMYLAPSNEYSLNIGDLDGDGRPDLVLGGQLMRQLPGAGAQAAPRLRALRAAPAASK